MNLSDLRDMKSYNPILINPWNDGNRLLICMLNSPKMELLRQIWDDSCDTILKGTIEKYAWDWEDHIVKALHNQLLSEKLHAIDEVCNDTLNLYRICEEAGNKN